MLGFGLMCFILASCAQTTQLELEDVTSNSQLSTQASTANITLLPSFSTNPLGDVNSDGLFNIDDVVEAFFMQAGFVTATDYKLYHGDMKCKGDFDIDSVIDMFFKQAGFTPTAMAVCPNQALQLQAGDKQVVLVGNSGIGSLGAVTASSNIPASISVTDISPAGAAHKALEIEAIGGNQSGSVSFTSSSSTSSLSVQVNTPVQAYVCIGTTALEASFDSTTGILTVVDCAGYSDELLTVSTFQADLIVTTNSKTWQLTGGTSAGLYDNGAGGAIGIPLSSVTGLIVDTKPTATSADIFTSAIPLNLPSGLDVHANTIQLQPIVIDTTAAPLTLNGFKTVATSTAGATLKSTSGAISVFGNHDGAACRGVTGTLPFSGINVSGIDITSTSGALSLQGCGGNSGVGNNGIGLGVGSLVKSTTGSITISGQGGNAATEGNNGVFINAAKVESDGTAPVNVTGTAGTSGTTLNIGVVVFNPAAGTYGTSGIYSKDGDISVTGQGGINTTGISSVGVRVQGAAEIKSTGAAKINIEGNGGSGDCPATNPNPILNECSHNGIDILINARVVAAGSGTIALEGRGGSGNGREHHGITISIASSAAGGNSAKVMSNGPDITLTGFGGTDPSTSKVAGSGIYLIHGGSVEATNGANIIMNGTAGKGLNEGNGIWLEGDFKNANGGLVSSVSAQNGSITMIGKGNIAAGSENNGIVLLNGDVSTTGAGSININGTGGSGSLAARGVLVVLKSKITTGAGIISVTGTGGTDNGDSSTGVAVSNQSEITSNSGSVNVTGTGGTGLTGNQGVVVGNFAASFANAAGAAVPLTLSKIQTTSGPINVTGIAGGSLTGQDNVGVKVGTGISTGHITSTNGSVTVEGTGGKGDSGSIGVHVRDGGTISSSAVTVTGTRGTSNFNLAVYRTGGGNILQGGSPANMPGDYLPTGSPLNGTAGTSATVTF